jgi:hypothetical protein
MTPSEMAIVLKLFKIAWPVMPVEDYTAHVWAEACLPAPPPRNGGPLSSLPSVRNSDRIAPPRKLPITLERVN